MTEQITVPILLEQLKAVHQVWLEFSSILGLTDRDKFESLLDLLEPLNNRLANVVFEEWETLIDKAEKDGGAQEVKGGQGNPSEVQVMVGDLDGLGYAIEEIQAVYAELRKNTGLEQLPVSQQGEEGGAA